MAGKCCDNEELNNEVICATCGNKITDPLIMRCPRCFTSLIPQGCSGGCHGCGQKTGKGGN